MQDFIYKKVEDDTYCVMAYEGDEANVVIPASYMGAPVTMLFDKLFAGHTEITSVQIPDTVTDLGEFLFDGCDNLKEIKLPAGLRNLWGYTFVRSAFEEIVLPDGVTMIPPCAFKDCKSLKRVVCGAGMRRIYEWAFGGCDALTEVVCGPDVTVSPDAYKSKD